MPDDDDNIVPLRSLPLVTGWGTPQPETLVPGGDGLPDPTYVPVVEPRRLASLTEDDRLIHPFAGLGWPLVDAAIEYLSEKAGVDLDTARPIVEGWMREEKVQSRGEVGSVVAPRIIQLTAGTWMGLLPLQHGSIAFGAGDRAGKGVRAIRISVPDLLVAMRELFGELPPTAPPMPVTAEHPVVDVARFPGAADARPPETQEGSPVETQEQPDPTPKEAAPNAPDQIVASDRTGAPGAPSSMHVIKAEMRRRAAAGEMTNTTILAEVAVLAEWLKATHPQLRPVTAKTIQNQCGREIRRLMAIPELNEAT